jgi:signal peptidase I
LPKLKFSRLFKAIGFGVLSFGVISAYVRAFTIAAPSMSPTFLTGDFIMSNHAAYDLRWPHLDRVMLQTGEPQQGDLIMYFDIPKNVIATKRIIGLPGDVVKMENNVLYVNGIAAQQTQLPRNIFAGVAAENGLGERVVSETLGSRQYLITYTPGKSPVRDFDEVRVTHDKYFILGDHRDNSADSRYIGLISRDQIKGRVFQGARTLATYEK